MAYLGVACTSVALLGLPTLLSTLDFSKSVSHTLVIPTLADAGRNRIVAVLDTQSVNHASLDSERSYGFRIRRNGVMAAVAGQQQ